MSDYFENASTPALATWASSEGFPRLRVSLSCSPPHIYSFTAPVMPET